MTKPSITKAVIPAAGMGTRFLPATKAMPKEMLPVVDKPVIQYVVEDAVSAGIEDIIVVTGWHKRILEDHFDYPYELISRLEEVGKLDQANQVRQIANLANFIYIRQKGVLGNATPFLNAEPVLNNQPFLGLWGDDFFVSSPSRSQQLVAAYDKYQAPILSAIKTTNPEDGGRYAFAVGQEIEPGVIKIDDIIEKPGVGKAASDLAVVSGFVFTPEFIEHLKQVEPQPGQELVYVDGLRSMLKQGLNVYAVAINGGTYYDCGNKLEYLKANLALGLDHPEFGPQLKDYIKTLANS